MTQEEKQLLLKDLCGRLLYGAVMNVTEPGDARVNFNCFLGPDTIKEIISETGHFKYKPYFRPMSSMTEEEEKELKVKFNYSKRSPLSIRYHSDGYWDDDTSCDFSAYLWFIDWLNAHHFDYRGLIKKGLALEAPEGMYK